MALPNLHILGIQGSGKGTQSALLVEKYRFLYLPSGNLFRERAAKHDALGKKIEAEMHAGRLLPDAYLYHTVIDTLNEHPFPNGILGDGVIRTMEQYKQLEPIWHLMNLNTPLLIHILLTEAVALDRITHRVISHDQAAKDPYHLTYSGKLARRDDDNPKAIEERFLLFHQMTQPIINHFAKGNRYIKVDGNRGIEEINADICRQIEDFYPTLHGTH